MTTATPIRMAHEMIDRPALLLAFALGANPWQLGCTPGAAQRPRERHVPARTLEAVRAESRTAKARCGRPAAAPVISGDEAGRAGGWLHRGFVTQGVGNGGVDASSLAVHRRPRRAQTARRDGQQVLPMLLRHGAGERKGWRSVRVPRVEEADRRPWPRAVTTATRDRTRGSKRRKGWLASHGLGRPPARAVPPPWEPRRLGDGAPLPAGRRPRLQQEGAHVVAVAQRLAPLAADRRAVRQTAEEAVTHKGQPLLRLQGSGSKSAWRCVRELCGWRAWHKRQEVGALSGLTPPPSARGHTADAQGIAQAGNAHRRAMAMAMAWGWRRLQPQSALPPW
jgi:transposase